MTEQNNTLFEKISLFHPYLKKFAVIEKLAYINKFPNFNQVYSALRQENKKADTAEIIAKSLTLGIEDGFLNENDLDELLFLILEDSLFNSFLYKLETQTFDIKNHATIASLLKSWDIPLEHKILNNINTNSTKDFVICGYRIADDENGLESLRILLLDSKNLNVRAKNEDIKKIVFPTLIEIDFRRDLLHIRLRDVDNIIGESEKFSTMSGRIENTLNFISSFNPNICFKEIKNFKNSLYSLEEHLLNEKRNEAYTNLEEFDEEIGNFTDMVCKKFNPSPSLEISPREYINTGVLSIIATTLNENELGDVVGIKFRDTQSDEKKYAEITIKDTGNKCISTSNLYWLNLSVLHNTKEVEYLKIIPQLENGVAVVNLEFLLDTANIRLLQRSTYDDTDGTRPSQEKYDDLIDFIKPFII